MQYTSWDTEKNGMIPAGTILRRRPEPSARDCLTLDERASTPPEIRKYRRSTNLEPGKRFTHFGLADDLDKMGLEKNIYGVTSDRGNGTAAELINHRMPTDLEQINKMKAENVYKSAHREILGKTVDRNVVLPDKFTRGKVPFGMTTVSSLEPAKAVIFPQFKKEDVLGEDIYVRSHGTYGPGEQKNRHYEWPVDPSTTRFGQKGDTIAFNGVSKNVADILNPAVDGGAVSLKKVEDFRGKGDLLGQSKNLGMGSGLRPPDMVYGLPSSQLGLAATRKGPSTAAEVIKGKYSDFDQQPDNDLGKAITPGFRNIHTESRAFGCPSVRTDLPHGPMGRRSVADSQNYGDDPSAKELINPPAFSDMSFPEEAMSNMRTKESLIGLFERIGFTVPADVADVVFAEASQDGVVASINSFRNALNGYLDARDQGEEASWRYAKGMPTTRRK